MRVTGPTLRRRNYAWLQMRSLDRRAARLARRQQQDDDASEDADVSGDESADDSDSDTEPTTTSRPPAASATVGVTAPTTATPLPTPRAGVLAGVTLAAGEPDTQSGVGRVEAEDEESDGMKSDSESSADESTTRPPKTTQPPRTEPPRTTLTVSSSLGNPNFATRLPPPPSATSTRQSSSRATPITALRPIMWPTTLPASSASRSSSLDELVTSIIGLKPTAISTLSFTSVPSATRRPSPGLPATGGAQAEEDKSVPPGRQAYEKEGDGLSIGQAPNNKLSAGSVSGIVVGVLAFVGLLAGAALLWRKRRRDRGLPFLPQKRYRLDEDGQRGPDNFAGGAVGSKSNAPVKTNTQIMDDLMKAAYAADNGMNDMEGAFAPSAVPKLPQSQSQPPPPPPPQQQQQPQAAVGAFMDEKAYMALAGPPTPRSPKKPVMKWLYEVKTPTQPNGPEIPPTPRMPSSPEIAQLPAGGTRMPEAPRQTYWGRDTMTTETTNTSVRWYG